MNICRIRWWSICLCAMGFAILTSLGFAEGGQAKAAKEPLPFAHDPNPSTYHHLPRHDVLVTGATLLDGIGGKYEKTDILLHDGKIVAVGKDLSAPENTQVIDAAGRWITPGVIDIHSHNGTYVLPLTSEDEKVSDVSEVSEPNEAQIWIEHGVNVHDPAFMKALAGGVTTLEILPGSSPFIGGRSVVVKPVPAETIEQMKFPGAQQGVKMACGENPKSEFGKKGKFPTSRMGEIAGMRNGFIKAQTYIKAWEKYEKDPAAKEPPERNLELDTLAGILQGDLRVQLHCYRSDDIAVMLGVANEFNFHIAAVHHATEAYKIPDLLKDRNVCAAVWADWWGFKMEAADAIRAGAAMLDKDGVCTMMHSDSPVTGQRLNIEAAKAMGAGRRAGIDIPPARAIRWLTSNPAKALGLEDRIGQIKPGYDADIVIWSGNPFSIYTKADQVFIDGALAYDRSNPDRQPRSDFDVGRMPQEGQP